MGTPGAAPRTTKLRRRGSTIDLQALKAELLADPDIAISNNLESFERKFIMQQGELATEMRRIIHHQGDLVISAVTAGPHDRIIDPVSNIHMYIVLPVLNAHCFGLRTCAISGRRWCVSYRNALWTSVPHSLYSAVAGERQSAAHGPRASRLLPGETRQASEE